MSEPAVSRPRETDADGAEETPDGDDPERTGATETTDPERTEATDDAEETEAATTTGAAAVVDALESIGVETLFGVQGGAIMPVYDAVGNSDLRHVTMAHEQGAAHAADAYGIVAGEPGVCLATSGPGATNLVTGLADADVDSDPLVALTGQVPTGFVGSDAFQETDTTGVTAPVTKANYFADDADTVGDTVGEAFALAGAGRPGPTLVDLPKDVTLSDTEAREATAETPEHYDPREAPDAAAVAAAARTLEGAERPLVLAGGGVVKGEASDELRAFATEHDVPVATSMPAVGTFPEDHDRSVGMVGMHGTGAANMAVTHCDTLFAVGCRFDDRLTGGVETFAPEATVVHVDIDPAEMSKNVYADVPVVGDAATALAAIADEMDESPGTDAWRERVDDWQAEYPMTYHAPEDGPVKPQFVVEAFDEATDADTIVTTGVGQHQMWAVQFWTFTEPRTWVSSHGLGTMGYGLPAAIGARLAVRDAAERHRDGDGETVGDDDRDVVCFDGDGSFLMTVQELSVAVRENLDITVAVLNNEYIGMVRQWQDAFFDRNRVASKYDWCPDFATLAEAFGAKGFTVDHPEAVPDAVEAALAYDGPSVVDFHIDPHENVYPMVPSGGANGRFALSEDQL